MSFGDPNNPYGQQPGYGQQQPQQPGYGYPQAPPVQGYGGGYPGGVPQEMPGSVKGARVMLFVIGGLQALGALIAVLFAFGVNEAKDDPSLQDDADVQAFLNDLSGGLLWVVTLLIVAWGVFAVVLGTRFANGGNGIRVTTMVFGIITAILGLYPFLVIGLVHTVLAILITVFVGKSDGGAWFSRPRA